jgi:hypothetical protein
LRRHSRAQARRFALKRQIAFNRAASRIEARRRASKHVEGRPAVLAPSDARETLPDSARHKLCGRVATAACSCGINSKIGSASRRSLLLSYMVPALSCTARQLDSKYLANFPLTRFRREPRLESGSALGAESPATAVNIQLQPREGSCGKSGAFPRRVCEKIRGLRARH